ncbi:SDR family NAD(P)-dependent oxidoreductase [Archangium sp.]|uniref:SDR family NAD(P)-dependent oxidoreductase n=1 Tax=Archangium sp. TaxID=1872627 RepID=UPI002D4B7734|nr:SDR family NAD(P)-dependent oxidoreductase [Archangium sp.]HYO55726.1 SDR family NAD(P)-dependent oxidoreductase [Archangium sp.]
MKALSGVPLTSLKIAPVAADDFRADGWRVAIVGGTGGIGRALARFLVAKGARVTAVGQTVRDAGVPGLDFVKADLSLMSEARRAARELPAEELDAVILTTGTFASPTREVTAEGIERDLAVSFLSRVVVVRALAGRLGTQRAGAARRPRIFVMGFPGTGQAGVVDDLNSERRYDLMVAHMNTVAGNEAFVLHAAKVYPRFGVYGLNPGLIKTDIRANALGGRDSLRFKVVEWFIGLTMMSAEKYAARVAPVMLAPELEGRTAVHFNQKGIAIKPSEVMTESHVERLMAAAEAVLARATA